MSSEKGLIDYTDLAGGGCSGFRTHDFAPVLAVSFRISPLMPASS